MKTLKVLIITFISFLAFSTVAYANGLSFETSTSGMFPELISPWGCDDLWDEEGGPEGHETIPISQRRSSVGLFSNESIFRDARLFEMTDGPIDDDEWYNECGWSLFNYEAPLALSANVRVRFHPNGGGGNIRERTRQSGRQMGSMPRRPSRPPNRRFVGWFTSSANVGGTRVRSSTTVPNVTTWNLHARWTDPTRHLTRWWRPATSGTTTINVRNFNLSPSSFQTGAQRGIRNWNYSTATVRFNLNNTSRNRVLVRAEDPDRPTRLGVRVIRWRTGTRIRRWDIRLYRDPITRHANARNYSITNVVENVMTHELGHVVGLADNPTSGNGSVMNTNRSRNIAGLSNGVPRVPTSYDITSVRMIYN